MADLTVQTHAPSTGPDLAWLTPERARLYAVSAMLILTGSATVTSN